MNHLNITTATKTFYDFMEMCHEINNILEYDQRSAGKHFHPGSGSMIEWHESKGHDIHSTDKEYNIKNSEMYREAVKSGEYEETPYMDFWHWQLDHCVDDNFHNDGYSSVYVGIDNDYIFKNVEDWQMEIQKVWHEAFKDIADEEGWIDIWVSW